MTNGRVEDTALSGRGLAFDIGASSGRAMAGTLCDGRVELVELHRFPNEPVFLGETLHWDFLRLFHNIREGLSIAAKSGGFTTVGVDTWGVDFGLLDAGGSLIGNPVHYRDRRTEGMMEDLFSRVDRKRVYLETGIQVLMINTLFQLLAMKKSHPDMLQTARKLLFTPDLFNYFLTGIARTEYTYASTSALLRPVEAIWSPLLLDNIGMDDRLFAPIIDAGTPLGPLSASLRRDLRLPKATVVAVASHDTASAVLAVPAEPGEEVLFISSGTWSVMGVESPVPVINSKSMEMNFSNEGGFGRTTRLLKNIMGLWLIQETRRQWNREGKDLSYADMEHAALLAKPFRSLMDSDEPAFTAMGDMPARIREACRVNGEPVPESVGEVTRCIYENLALKYRMVKEEIEALTGKRYDRIHVVGGGTKDGLLSQFTANATGVAVTAGPVEATALGNLAVQWMATGRLSSREEARKVIRDSFPTKEYQPDMDVRLDWENTYNRFKELIRRGS